MQQTRRFILDILHETGEATVDQLVLELRKRIQHNITAVTVRHHLDILRSENLVTAPAVRRSGSPGRPQYVFSLTEHAFEHFPHNYQELMNALLAQLKSSLPPPQVNVILDHVADHMVSQAQAPNSPINSIPLEIRLDHAVEYLNNHGYEASWERDGDGFVLHTHNCPYHKVAATHQELCGMDMRLVAGLLGVVPRLIGRLSSDDDSCAYHVAPPLVSATA